MKKVVLFKSTSEDYEQAFSDRNYEVIFIEPLQFLYINLNTLGDKLVQTHYDGLILTSARAIEAVAKCWDPTKFVIWKSKKVYTVGEVSGLKVKSLLGLDAIGTDSGNAETLAKVIIRENKEKSIFLFPCGNLSSETLPRLVEDQGMTVDSVTVYETKENERLKSDLMVLNSSERPCGMVFFSPSGCEYTYRRLQTFTNELSQLPHFAIGNSTAHKIENLGIEIAGVAAKPRADSVADSVQQYFESIAVS